MSDIIKVNAHWREKPYYVNLNSKKSQFVKKSKSVLKMIAAIVVVAATVYISFAAGVFKGAAPLKYIKDPSLIASELMDQRIGNAKNNLLAALSTGCETKSVKDPDGTIIFDSNSEASIGRYQFQRKTVIHYYKQFYNQTISNAEAIAIAIDPVKSSTLAADILFKDPAGYRNWVTCANTLDLKTKVEVIKAI